MRHFGSIRVALAGGIAAFALIFGLVPAASAEPVKIRAGWVVTPASMIPFVFSKPGLAQHQGKTYVLEPVRMGASSQHITALAAGEIEIAMLNYASLPLAVLNAKLDDLRIICDEITDGAPGHYSVQFWVRKDSGIAKVEDLKGKMLATNGFGTGTHMATRVVMGKRNLKEGTDYRAVEVPFPGMAAALADKKVDLAVAPNTVVHDPKFLAMAREVFTMRDAFGASTLSFWTARADFIAKNRGPLTDLIEDYIRAVRWYTDPKNHDEAIAIVSAFTKIPAATFKGWLFTKDDFYRDPNGLVDLDALQRNVQTAKDLGVIPGVIDAKKHGDFSLARAAAARLK